MQKRIQTFALQAFLVLKLLFLAQDPKFMPLGQKGERFETQNASIIINIYFQVLAFLPYLDQKGK